MDAAPKLIESVAALLWPLIVILVIILFRPAVAALIGSARTRKFTIKVGGQELTMEEVNQQQLVQNRDLLQRLAELTQKVDGASPSPAKDNGRVVSPSPSVSNLVLWVDDNPGNNAFFVEYLGKAGIQTDIAVSTAVGQRKFKPGKYRFVISDMGRRERHGYNSDAGIDLLDAVRAEDQSVPFFIYCSTQAKNRFGQIALDRGASGVTASPTELFSLLGIGQQELGL